MTGGLVLVIALLLSAVTCRLVLGVLKNWKRVQTLNYLGERVTGSAGIAIVAGSLVGWLVLIMSQSWLETDRLLLLAVRSALGQDSDRQIWVIFPLVAFVFCLIGLSDDLWGNPTVRGLRGHLKSFFDERKLTTGAVKAVLGSLLALVVSFSWHGVRLEGLTGGCLIALSANFINLLDKRPGRALKGFWLYSLLATVMAGPMGVIALSPLIAASLSYAPDDLHRRGMLGDAGSNPLGGAVGLVPALLSPLSFQVALCLILTAIHLYAETRSLTEDIKRSRILSWLDRLGT
ncbi:MAG: hypothetical protein RMK62_08655 [Armatimonadota bacterium]|nr:hypothetical protein [Armatimonadota bacterium]